VTARWLALPLLTVALAACPSAKPPLPVEPKDPVPQTVDVLGEKPQLSSPIPFKAPEPEVYQTEQGMTVWLIERHALPVVSFSLSIPTGAADDPPGKAGLAHMSAGMMDEGAGDRGAIEISDTINDLGADMWTSVGRDGSRASLTVLSRNLDEAFEVYADVVARPRFEEKEFQRVHKQWLDGLTRRNDSVSSVARVVRAAVLYGPGTPYGHPSSGLIDTAKKIDLEGAKAFYRAAWRPDQATLVVGGDITREKLDALLAKHFDDWVKPKEPAPPRISLPKPLSKRPKLVLVDRPGAPQSVITIIGDGVPADSEDGPLLDLVNTALGGSFTSRLNQNLREDHGWTYGARSGFVETRGVGPFVASSAVFTNVTAPALREMLAEIDKMAASGLTDDEYKKVRARDLTDLIETNETLGSLVGRLSSLGILGLGYEHDAQASQARQAASKAELDALAKRYLDTSKMSIIIVGPKDQVLPQLKTLGMDDPEMWSVEGRPLAN
jgi:predicted Zn-dependent peptidase